MTATKGELMATAKEHKLVADGSAMDAAIPQRVADRIYTLAQSAHKAHDMGDVNSSHFCWLYEGESDLYGRLFPLTVKGGEFLRFFKEKLGMGDYADPIEVAEELFGCRDVEKHRMRRRIKELANHLCEKRSDITEILYDILEDKKINVGDVGKRFLKYPLPGFNVSGSTVVACLVDSETGFLELEDETGNRVGEAISPSAFND